MPEYFLCLIIEKKNLLPILEKNIYTNSNPIMNINFRIRIYSDCYSVYRKIYFNDMSFILDRVNHSIWFGRWCFYIYTMEGLLEAIKRIKRNFIGLNFKVLDYITKDGYDASKYVDDWIFSVYFKEIYLVKI